MELSGRVAFVTGSARGIGKACAEVMLQKGVKVFINDIDEKAGADTLAEFQGKFGTENVRFAKLDISNEKNFEEVFQAAIEAFGAIDIMVNNAGIMNESAWQLMIQINLLGSVKGTKLAEEHMRKDKGGKGGRIVNISSITGLVDACPAPIYCATKQAIRAFTMSQAGQYDLQARGLQYAVICPDRIDTDIISQADDTKMNFYDVLKPHLGENLIATSCVGDVLMMLLQLEQMNGAIVKVNKFGTSFKKMEMVDLGESYKSSLSSGDIDSLK